ncbi:MAG: FadR family transcriptional regulator, partial [Actinobacteria bacterium]
MAAQRRARSAETVANLIRTDIETGRLREGDKLPSIRQLMALHGIGRGAAQAAMSTLLAEG